MPVVATRIQYLDKDTNTGVANFNTVTNNGLLNTGENVTPGVNDSDPCNTGNITNGIESIVKTTTGAINKGINDVSGYISDTYNNVNNSINDTMVSLNDTASQLLGNLNPINCDVLGVINDVNSNITYQLNNVGLPSSLAKTGINVQDFINGKLSPNTNVDVLNNIVSSVVPDQLKQYINVNNLSTKDKINISNLVLSNVKNQTQSGNPSSACQPVTTPTVPTSLNVSDQLLSTFIKSTLGDNSNLINCVLDDYKNKQISYSDGSPAINVNTFYNALGGRTFTLGNLTYVQISPDKWKAKNNTTGTFDTNIYDDLYVFIKVKPEYYKNITLQMLKNFYNYIKDNRINNLYRCYNNTSFTIEETLPSSSSCTSINKIYILPMTLLTKYYTDLFTDNTMPKPPITNYYDTNKDFINYMLVNQDLTDNSIDPTVIINLGV